MQNFQWQSDEIGTREVNSEVDWKLTELFGSWNCRQCHNWRLIDRGVAQGSIPYPILFKIFSTKLNDEAECTLSKSEDDAKLWLLTCWCSRCLGCCSEGWERQEKWAENKWRVFPIYPALVRLCWEHCVHSWDPQYKRNVDILEWVLWRVTKISEDLEHLSYKKRLKELCLSQLEKKRLRTKEGSCQYVQITNKIV